MAEPTWTVPQQDAIEAKGGQVLVSAAAGSGKTAVLVERAVRLLTDGDNPVDANRLLIVTFSRAAAAEMKQRLALRISAMLRERPEDLHLQRQQSLLAGAQISTVDAFCMDLVRQNFQHLEVSPDFAILDPGEQTILEEACVKDTIEDYYEEKGEESFFQLVELLSTAKSDKRLAETILKIYAFSRSHPFFEEWLRDMLGLYDEAVPVAESEWGKSILRHGKASLAHCLALTRHSLDRLAGDEKMEKAYGTALRSDRHQLEACKKLADAGDWDGLASALGCFSFEKLGPLRGDDPIKERVKESRDHVKKAVQELQVKYFSATSSQVREDILALRPMIEVLFRMVAEFSARTWEAKMEKKRLDFADVEHLALRLLVKKVPGGYLATPKAAEVAALYDYVLVDEFQDTNEVQDLLFSCVSLEGQRNLFMVGDVKQSIYRFRQARPEIFMEKKRTFFPYKNGAGQYPARISLDQNFRSRRTVTEAVNAVFALIMSDGLGEVDYNEEESLKCGAVYPEAENTEPEFLLTSIKGYAGSLTAAEIEAEGVAGKIQAMMAGGYQVSGKDGARPLRLSDICILMRSPRGRAEAYVKTLARHGIAAGAESAGSYLAAREVSVILSFLRALDNPLLDVELVAVLLSPLFDFTADDIARFRLLGRGLPFYSLLRLAEKQGDEKARSFCLLFDRLRTEAAVLPADKLLLLLYEETAATEIFSAMRMGAGRRANLLLLVEYAAEYHRLGYRQLGGFVGFLGRLQERGGDLAPAASVGDGAEIVRVMSIHHSKGLEFPVVFLADTAHQFNKMELRENTMLHPRFGFASVRRDTETTRQYATVPLESIRLESLGSMLSEEMRILYVAMTRAREKLIVTAVIKAELQKKLADLAEPLDNGRLTAHSLASRSCYADWILAALLHHASCEKLREAAGADDLDLFDDGNPWRIETLERVEDRGQTGTDETEAVTAPFDPGLIETLRQNAGWSYPYLGETRLPTKLAVSDVAKGEKNVEFRFKARPRFLSEQKLTPAERGNAMHKFMQFASYERARDDLAGEIRRMGEERFLSKTETASLPEEKLRAFFSSALASRIFASEKVYRELRFMAECGEELLGDVLADMGDGKVVLQGVADCVFIENGEAVIVDYKSDAVSSMVELRDRYATQLRLYRRILSDSLGVRVKECVLYSFHLSEAALVD